MTVLAVKSLHNSCGVDQVCVGGRFALPRKLCGSGSYPAQVLIYFIWILSLSLCILNSRGVHSQCALLDFLATGVTWYMVLALPQLWLRSSSQYRRYACYVHKRSMPFILSCVQTKNIVIFLIKSKSNQIQSRAHRGRFVHRREKYSPCQPFKLQR